MRIRAAALLVLAACALTVGCNRQPPVPTLRIPLGAGGVGFLPLFVMREQHLIEKHARAAGIENLEVRWIELGGPAVMTGPADPPRFAAWRP
jgi:NitT/TauT family transport system substrate-binding protein